MTTCCIELETIRAQLADLQAHYEAALEAEQVRHRQLTEAQQRITELEANLVSLTLKQTMRKAGEKSNIRLALELKDAKEAPPPSPA